MSAKILENFELIQFYGQGAKQPKLTNLSKQSKNQWKPAIFDNFKGNFAIFSNIL